VAGAQETTTLEESRGTGLTGAWAGFSDFHVVCVGVVDGMGALPREVGHEEGGVDEVRRRAPAAQGR